MSEFSKEATKVGKKTDSLVPWPSLPSPPKPQVRAFLETVMAAQWEGPATIDKIFRLESGICIF